MKKYLIFALSLFTALSVGCGSDYEYVATNPTVNQPNPVGPPTPPPPTNDKSRLRIVNPTGDVNNLIVSVNGTVVDPDLDAQESTKYLEFNAGSHLVEIGDGSQTLASQTVTLTKDGHHSSVFIPRPQFANQTTVTTPALIFLTDDTVPTPATLKARLVNATNYDGQITLFNDNNVALLGPATEGTAINYVTLGASAANSKNFQALIQVTELADLLAIFEQESNGDQLVEALIEEIGAAGANVTLFIHYSQPNGRAYATALLDEASDGSRSILSTAPTQFANLAN